jgi:hypothetical protein
VSEYELRLVVDKARKSGELQLAQELWSDLGVPEEGPKSLAGCKQCSRLSTTADWSDFRQYRGRLPDFSLPHPVAANHPVRVASRHPLREHACVP